MTAVATSILVITGGTAVAENPPLIDRAEAREFVLFGQVELYADLQSAQNSARKASELRKLKAELVYQTQLAKNKENIEKRILEALDRVGKTRYVFSGSTPAGWDCSGFTRWFYEELGVELPHSASDQSKLGVKVDTPQIGDLMLIGTSAKNIYHAAIYIGDNLWIHSGWKPGTSTEVLPLDHPTLATEHVEFRRLIDISE